MEAFPYWAEIGVYFRLRLPNKDLGSVCVIVGKKPKHLVVEDPLYPREYFKLNSTQWAHMVQVKTCYERDDVI